MNTSCKNCYFASTADSEVPCELGIINSIKDLRELSIKEDYYYISNYACRYGISADVYNDKIKDMDVNIKDYAIKRSEPKYFLCVIADNTEDSIVNICNKIKQLSIPPTAVSIFTHESYVNRASALNHCKNILSNSLDWKLHVRLDDLSNEQKAIKNLVSTDNRTNSCGYIFFLKENLLNHVVENNSITKIEHILNVLQQPDVSVLCSRLDKSYFNGVFIRMDNFKVSTSTLLKNIGDVIRDNYTEFVGFYD